MPTQSFLLAAPPLCSLFSIFVCILLSTCAALASNPDGNIVYIYGVAQPATVMLTGHQEYNKVTSQLAEKLGLTHTDPSRVISRDLLPTSLQQSSIELLTPRGRTVVKIKDATLQSGCAFWQLYLQTDKELDVEFEQGIARLGAPFPPSAKLRRITGVPGTDATVSKIAPRFKAWVESKLSPEEQQHYQKLKTTLSDFRFEKGVFSQKGKWLAWVGLESSEGRDRDAGEMTFKGAAILDATGTPIETLEKPYPGVGDGIGGWSPLFGIDTDADGIEELVYQTNYYEGGSVLIRHERKQNVFNTILMSDGC